MTTLTEEEVSHAHALLYAEPPEGLGICGCGNPEEALALVRDLLVLAPFYDNPAAVEARIVDPGARHLVLSMLDNAGLIEHGSSIGGAWLTAKGAYCRRVLTWVTWDAIDDSGFPHDGAGCGDACWQEKEKT